MGAFVYEVEVHRVDPLPHGTHRRAVGQTTMAMRRDDITYVLSPIYP